MEVPHCCAYRSPFGDCADLGKKFAKQIGQSVEELKKNLTEGDREYFKADVIRDKAVKFLCDNAKAE